MDLGPHAAFIWLAYGAVLIVLAALIAWLVVDGRRQRRRLDAIESRARRGARAPAPHD